MLTSVKYTHEAGIFAWPIPFAYTTPTQVGVNVVNESGQERRLAYGLDYQIQGANVIYVLPPGQAIIIWLDAVAADVLAANNAASLQAVQPATTFASLPAQPDLAAPHTESEPAPDLALSSANSERIAQLEAQLSALQEEKAQALLAERARAADAEIQNITTLANEATAKIAEHVQTAALAVEMAQASAEDAINDAAALADAATARAEAAGERAKLAAIYTENKTASTLKALESHVVEFEACLAKSVANGEQAVALAANAGEARIAEATQAAQAEAARAASLAGQVWPQQGWLIAATAVAPGGQLTLPEPLAYYPGRASLSVSRNGFVLALGKHFTDVGDALTPSTRITLVDGCNAGDIFSFFIAPTTESQAAAQAAAEAKVAASMAQDARAGVDGAYREMQTLAAKMEEEGNASLAALQREHREAANELAILRDNGLTEIRAVAAGGRSETVATWNAALADIKKQAASHSEALRELWTRAQAAVVAARDYAQREAEAAVRAAQARATAAGESAATALELAQCAWRAAFQASLDRAMPGIASVPGYADLFGRPSGMYVINPAIKQPLPFMGIFPVADLSEVVGHDGVFIMGAEPYPDTPKLPDIPYPENPAETPDMLPPAMSNGWLPCDHSHNQ